MAKKVSVTSTLEETKCFYGSQGADPTPYELGEKTVTLTNLMKEDGTFTERGIVFIYKAQEVSESVKESFTVTFNGTSYVDQIGPTIPLNDFKRLELDKTGVLYLFKLDNDCDHSISKLILYVDFLYKKDGVNTFVPISTSFNLTITKNQIETFGIYLDPESIASKTPQGVDGTYRFIFRHSRSDTIDKFIYSKPVLAKPSVALTEAFPYFKNASNIDKLRLIQAIFPPFWGTYTIGTVAGCLYDSMSVDSMYHPNNDNSLWGISYRKFPASEFYNYYLKVKYNLASIDVTANRNGAVRTTIRYFPYDVMIYKSKNEVTSKEGELEGFLRTRGYLIDKHWYPLLAYYDSEIQGVWSYEAVRWDLTSNGVYAYLRLCGITNEDMHSFFYSLPMNIEEFDFKNLRLALKTEQNTITEGNLVSASAVKDGKVISQIEVRIQQ